MIRFQMKLYELNSGPVDSSFNKNYIFLQYEWRYTKNILKCYSWFLGCPVYQHDSCYIFLFSVMFCSVFCKQSWYFLLKQFLLQKGNGLLTFYHVIDKLKTFLET
jgi:hypothetical protein